MIEPELYKRYCKQWSRYLQLANHNVAATSALIREAEKCSGYKWLILPTVWPSVSLAFRGIESFTKIMESIDENLG